jgi:hypothetical protein
MAGRGGARHLSQRKKESSGSQQRSDSDFYDSQDCPITHRVTTKKGLKVKLFAVLLDWLRGMFAVVELRF